jgi:hypothetical protein
MLATATVALSTTGSSQPNAPRSSDGIASTLAAADGVAAADADASAPDTAGDDVAVDGSADSPIHPASVSPTMASAAAR